MSPATFDRLAAPPEEPLYEIVNGHKVVPPPTGARSTWLASRMNGALGPFAKQHGFGMVVNEMLFILDREANLRLRPDVAFVSVERWPVGRELPNEDGWDVVPNLAVEVVGPNDLIANVLGKVGTYFDHGVCQVWVVVPPQRCVYIHDSRDLVRIVTAPAELETPLIPGWRLPLATLLRLPLPEIDDSHIPNHPRIDAVAARRYTRGPVRPEE